MDAIIWIFQNILPWAGLCSIVLTLIFFITFIILMIKEKEKITDHFYVLERSADTSVIVSIIPLLIILAIVYSIVTMREGIIRYKKGRL